MISKSLSKSLIGASLFCAALALPACKTLTTRHDRITKEPPMVKDLRKENADLKAKIAYYEEESRRSQGRIEEYEMQMKTEKDQFQEKMEAGQIQAKDYQASLEAIKAEKQRLEQEIDSLKNQNLKTQAALKEAQKSADQHLKDGDQYFEEKKWAESASSYQFYREKVSDKKTEEYALVSYKIGVCFQEMGMIPEAKTFYKSVKQNFKEFKAHKYASYRLSKIEESESKK